jgi:hypothetical protein
MSEYTNVERHFLDKLRQIGWKVIDHNDVVTIDFAYNQQEPRRYTVKQGHIQEVKFLK